MTSLESMFGLAKDNLPSLQMCASRESVKWVLYPASIMRVRICRFITHKTSPTWLQPKLNQNLTNTRRRTRTMKIYLSSLADVRKSFCFLSLIVSMFVQQCHSYSCRLIREPLSLARPRPPSLLYHICPGTRRGSQIESSHRWLWNRRSC